MKRRFTLLAIVSFMSLTVMAKWDGTIAESLTITDGVCEISTESQLAKLADDVKKGENYSGVTFIQMNDLDLGGVQDEYGVWSGPQWTPIGTYNTNTNIAQDDGGKAFKGSYNGNGFVISNIYFNNPAIEYAGLFGCVSGGHLENITITSGLVYGRQHIGGICGGIINSTIDCCANNASVYGKVERIGGICGYMTATTIKNCINYGLISGFSFTGGIVGLCTTANSVTKYCINVGQVFGMRTTTCGNLIGFNNGASSLTDCFYDNQINAYIGVAIDNNNTDIKIVNDRSGQYTGMPTTGIIGNGLKNVLDNEIWYFNDNEELLYPRLKTNYNKKAIIAAAAPIILAAGEKADSITTDFHVSTANGIVWTSGNSDNLLINDNGTTTIKRSTAIVLTANKDGYTKNVYIKTDIGTTKIDSLTIENEDDLIKLRKAMNNYGSYKGCANYDGFKGIIFIQKDKITLTNWTEPIGAHNSFKGHYIGKEIVGVNVTPSNISNVGGLFGCASYGSIENVTISGNVSGDLLVGGICGTTFFETITKCTSNCTVTAEGKNQIGGIVGTDRGYSKFTNCNNHGNVTGNQLVGGIVSKSDIGTQIINCKNDGTINGGNNSGGICGSSGSNNIFLNCENNGTVSAANGANVGGIIGTAPNNNPATIVKCINTGNITGKERFGGIVGYPYIATISNCLNVGTISTSGNGIAGSATNNVKITNCFNAGAASNAIASSGTIDSCLNIGIVTTVPAKCYFDNKLLPKSGDYAKKTSAMTGDALKSALGEEKWIFNAGMYPMPKGLENSDYMKLYATALILDDNDELSEVKNNFTVGTANDVEWSCNTSNVAFVNGEGIISNPGVDAEDANVIVTVSLGSITKSINLTIKATGKAEPSIKWVDDTDDDGIVDDINITYGQEITDAMLAFTFKNAEDEDKGTTVKNVNVGTKMDAGTHTLSVTFTPKAEYASAMSAKTITRKINVAKADAKNYISWTPQNITYGENYESKIKNAKMIVGDNEIQGTFTYNIPILNVGLHKEVSVSFENKNYYTSESVIQYIDVAKAKATISWTLAPIEYGTPISDIQLGAFSSFGPVTYQYKENVNGSKDVLTGVILPVGNYVICATIELGDDAGNYEGATIERTLVVNKATPTITWNKTYVETTYGNTLSADQLFASVPAKYQDKGNISYFVDGQPFDITANHSAGTYAISAKFTPNDNVNYSSVTTSTTATLTVKSITPTITWNNTAVTINYGETVSEDRLKASVEEEYQNKGTISYYVDEQPFDIRAQLGAGTYDVIAKFLPNDTHNYVSVTTPTPATITVHKSATAPTITWDPVTPIVFGTALSNAQLNASSEAPGTITYTENGNAVNVGDVLNAGDHTITATLSASTNYEGASKTVTIKVNPADPEITWEPQGYTWGATEEEYKSVIETATATFKGATLVGQFSYTYPSSMNAGSRKIKMTFTPNDADNFNKVENIEKTITVAKATPVVTWDDIEPITYGTKLWTTQLNAKVEEGHGPNAEPNYTLADGTNATNALLDAGTHEITATLEQSENYTEWTMTKTILVKQAEPLITWEPGEVAWGASEEEIENNVKNAVAKDAKGNVLEGNFTYVIPELNAVGEVEVSVTFENKNYITAAATTKKLNVTKAYPVITWTPQSVTYGASSAEIVSQIDNAKASYNGAEVKGSFAFDNLSTLNAGPQSITVTFTPENTELFNAVVQTAEITVEKATPAIEWNPKTEIAFGTALNDDVLNAKANVDGTFKYEPTADSVLKVGSLKITATFTPTDAANYNGATASVEINVVKANPVITWNTPEDITVGTALTDAQLNAKANVDGTFAYTPDKNSVLEVGEHQKLTVLFTPTDAESYNSVSDSVFINVAAAANDTTTTIDTAAAIVWVPSAIVYGTPVGETFNATAKVEGEITYSLSADSILNAGEYKVKATLSPVNGNDTTIERIVMVAKAELTATAANDTIVQGDTMPKFEINYKGFVGNDNVASLTTAPTATCSASTDSVGSFEIVVSGGEAKNYNFVHVNGLLVILAKNDTALIPIDTVPHNDTLPHIDTLPHNDTTVVAIITSWNHPKSLTYGELIDSTYLCATANMEGRFEYAIIAQEILDTMIYNATPAPLGVEDNNNRILSVGDTLTPGDYYLTATFYPADTTLSSVTDTSFLIVNRAILTVSVADVTINQGDAMPEFTILYKGFVFGENESILTNAPKAKCDANTNVAGIYEIVFWGSSGFSDNYELDFIDGKLTVLKKADDPSAINETAAIFEVYPNPTNGAFFVNAGDEAQEVRIFNSTGKLVKVETIEGVTRIDISEYADGMYFVKLGNQTKTIIKQ